jgi:CheY-like chemotaxis protein
MKRILLIDDEAVPGLSEPEGIYMWYYSEALRRAGYELEEVNATDEAIRRLSDPTSKFDLIILDIMMPPGTAFGPEETESGLRTGVLLADKLKDLRPKTPVLVLTNVADPDAVSRLQHKPNIARVLFKPDWVPFDVVPEVRTILGDQ